MKVGLLQFFSWSRRVPVSTVYDRAMDRVAMMEDSAFDCIWLAEHHFTTYSVCPSVTLMGTHIAARTKRLRIGTAVTLNAFYNPLRLAEELGMLDIFSDGRLNWGSGRGFEPTEFRAFGIDIAESADRFREAAEIVQKAWKSERFSHEGRFFNYEDVMVLPKPKQEPHPPIWLAATSPDSIKRASADGYSIMLDPHSSHAEIAYKRRYYQEQMEENGFTVGDRDVPIVRYIAVGETREKAKEAARESASWTVGAYAGPKQGSPASRGSFPGFERDPDADPVERYLRDVAIHGTAEEVTDRLLELETEIPMNYLMIAPMSHESFVLFTKKVLPKLLG